MKSPSPMFRRGLSSIAAAVTIKPLPSSPASVSASSLKPDSTFSSLVPTLSGDSGSHLAHSHPSLFSASSLNKIPALRPPPMASSARSADSSDVFTPRSTSPSPSVASGRSSHRSSRTSVSNKRVSISSRRLTDFNPMSSVDVLAIEEAMKLASLDQHRGYAQDHYTEVKQDHDTEYLKESEASAYQVLREPLWNKGRLMRIEAYICWFSFAFSLLQSTPTCSLPCNFCSGYLLIYIYAHFNSYIRC